MTQPSFGAGRRPRSGHNFLSAQEREAIRMAKDLREGMQDWMSRRGVVGETMMISPFVDPSGQASVLIRLNAHVALAMVLSFAEHHADFGPQRRNNGTYGARS